MPKGGASQKPHSSIFYTNLKTSQLLINKSNRFAVFGKPVKKKFKNFLEKKIFQKNLQFYF